MDTWHALAHMHVHTRTHSCTVNTYAQAHAGLAEHCAIAAVPDEGP